VLVVLEQIRAMAKNKKPPVRLILSLPEEIASGLDKEIRKLRKRHPGVHPTRASITLALIKSGLLRRVDTKEERNESYKLIVREANIFKNRGKEAMKAGDDVGARALYLKAAAAELDALSVLGTNDEVATKTVVIEMLLLLKAATGYKHLPEVPLSMDAPLHNS